jgi:hypothetical protein
MTAPLLCDAQIRVAKWFLHHRPRLRATVRCGKPGTSQTGWVEAGVPLAVVRCPDHRLLLMEDR